MKYGLRIFPVIIALGILAGMLLSTSSMNREAANAPLVLLYNHVIPDTKTLTSFEQKYYHVSTSSFQEQLNIMEKRGYQFVSLDAVLSTNGPMQTNKSPKASIIFYDAYDDFAHQAFPILKQKNIPATLFFKEEHLNMPGFLTGTELEALQDQNITIKPQNISFLNNRNSRTEISGVISRSQFEDLLPDKQYTSLAWAIIFSLVSGLIAYLSIKFPAKSLLIPIALIPTYMIRFSLLSIPISFLELVTICALSGTLLTQWRPVISSITSFPFRYPSLLFLMAALLSTIFADNKQFALGGLKALVLEPMALGYALYFWIKQGHLKPWPILLSLLISSFIVACIALFNFVIGNTYVDYTLTKLTTFFGNPNYLGSFLAYGHGIALVYLVVTKSLFKRIGILLLAIPITISMYLSKSDTLNLGLLATYGLFALTLIITKLHISTMLLKIYVLLAFFGTFCIFLAVASGYLYPILDSHGLGSMISRYYIYQGAAQIIAEHWLTGVGILNFHHLFKATVLPNIYEIDVALSHNTFLDFWTQMGILGLIGYIWIIVRMFQVLLRKSTLLTMGITGLMLVVLVHGMLDSQYHKNDYSMLFWILVSLTAALPFANEKEAFENL